MVRYELIPITHDELILFCRLGGRIDFDDPMQGDCYLIGSIGDNFNKLTLKEQKEIFDESKRYAYGRDDRSTSKTNARILVIHEV